MRRLAILSTHPIQYNAPFFRMLDEDPTLRVLVFFSKTSVQVKFDPDFQREIVWDIPVTEGYDHVSPPLSVLGIVEATLSVGSGCVCPGQGS